MRTRLERKSDQVHETEGCRRGWRAKEGRAMRAVLNSKHNKQVGQDEDSTR